MIFVDTGAWFASFVLNDPDHSAADACLTKHAGSLITTDYVVDELLTLMKRRGEFERAVRVGEALLNGSIADIEWVSPTDVQSAWDVFKKYRDKGWSFTDCTSFAIIERLAISTAFAFDENFRQFGNVTVVPA